MMRHGAMLWGAALYNTAAPNQRCKLWRKLQRRRRATRLIQVPHLGRAAQVERSASVLDPIPRWEISQPGNVLRVFERGGKRRLEVGLPTKMKIRAA